MANYSGVEYDPNFFRGEDEAMVDYINRLIDTREGGVMGTAQGITAVDPVTQEVTTAPLGEVTQNCPVGYVWDGTRCVPDGSGDGETPVPTKATLQQMIDAKTGRSVDPALMFGLFGPLGTAMGFGIQAARNSALKDALIESGMSEDMAKLAMEDPEYVAQQIYSGRVGDIKDVEGRYDPNAGGKWNPVGGVIDSLFGVGGLFGTEAVPKNSEYKLEGGGYLDVPAPVVFQPWETQQYGFDSLGQGLISGMGAEGNRQYYITSDGQVRDVSALQAATQAGLKALAANRAAGSTSNGYDPTMAEDYSGPSFSSGSGSTVTMSDYSTVDEARAAGSTYGY